MRKVLEERRAEELAVPGRIVLFGATGYTGRLTAEAMVERGCAPCWRRASAARLEELAAELGGGLETADGRRVGPAQRARAAWRRATCS